MIVGWVIFFGGIWLLLTILEPFVVYMETGAECDRKYARARERDEARMRELQEQHADLAKQLAPQQEVLLQPKSKRQLKREAWKARRKEKKLANNSTDSKNLLGP